jgi:hypothetical protein
MQNVGPKYKKIRKLISFYIFAKLFANSQILKFLSVRNAFTGIISALINVCLILKTSFCVILKDLEESIRNFVFIVDC